MEHLSPTDPLDDVAGVATLQWLDNSWHFPITIDEKWNGPLISVVQALPWLQVLDLRLGSRALNVFKSRVLATEHWYAWLTAWSPLFSYYWCASFLRFWGPKSLSAWYLLTVTVFFRLWNRSTCTQPQRLLLIMPLMIWQRTVPRYSRVVESLSRVYVLLVGYFYVKSEKFVISKRENYFK